MLFTKDLKCAFFQCKKMLVFEVSTFQYALSFLGTRSSRKISATPQKQIFFESTDAEFLKDSGFLLQNWLVCAGGL